MHPSEGGRLPWEYAEGPTVGDDVPITSPPRPEEKPGVPKPPPREPSASAFPEIALAPRAVSIRSSTGQPPAWR